MFSQFLEVALKLLCIGSFGIESRHHTRNWQDFPPLEFEYESMIFIGKVQEWLENHCHESGNVIGGMVTLTNSRDDTPLVTAQWPKEVAEGDDLLAAATASFRGRKSHFRAEPHSNGKQQLPATVVALPLHIANHAVGAIALQPNAGVAETALRHG
jgi:hypothetical protein